MDYNTSFFVSKTNVALLSSSRRASMTRSDSTIAIPSSTPNVIIVKCFDKPLLEPIGTITYKCHFDDSFPLFLRGKISESDFKYTIDGINWFADLLHEAEVEYYAHTYYQTEVWKPVYQALIREEERENVIVDLCKAKNEPIPPLILPRRRIKTEKDLKKFQSLVCQWLSNFIEDENNNIYLQQGVQFNSPEINQWRWLEIHVLPEGKVSPKPPRMPRPQPPEFGNTVKLTIIGSVELGDHTEYIIDIKSDLSSWYPYHTHKVLRRYNEFKAFYTALKADLQRKNLDIQLPEIPEATYFGRKSKSTIEKRKKLFQELLDQVSKPPTCTHPFVLRFLGIKPQPLSWRFWPYFKCGDNVDAAPPATVAPVSSASASASAAASSVDVNNDLSAV